MKRLTTGMIDNSPVNGARPSQQLTLQLVNRNAGSSSSVLIQGSHGTGMDRKTYILQTVDIPPKQAKTIDYYADFDKLLIEVKMNDEAGEDIDISLWGRNTEGLLTMNHPVYSENPAPQVFDQQESIKTSGFGSLYGNDEEHSLIGRFESIQFYEAGPAMNMTPDLLKNGLSVTADGIYEITAELTVLLTARKAAMQGASFELFRGNEFLPGSGFDLYVDDPETKIITTIGRTIQSTLTEGDAISIRVSAALNHPYYRSASLIVKRLH
ncbi:hypothetical protein D3H55_06970 [Bacillus salacetis]|uniref:Uncharacterized protein n=1 Tax=Bacillus salacetis TaxID=2315464 RepID=A0A3A1R1G4_9BACI|nr:hypothetical protein [Bacillus salacetis]RIW35619.1 hypothetical protein D3H55_06970 [Bacillus salacetis]